MPSPFPGFDPYLESPAEWRSFHNAFISALAFALNEQLPPPFVARQDTRLYVVPHHQNIYPDVLLAHLPNVPGIAPASTGTNRVAGDTMVQVQTPSLRITLLEEQIRESFIEIRIAEGEEMPVTVIEVLSPTNKGTFEGRSAYRRKQEELLQSRVHLIEIDLLRSGDPNINLTPRRVISTLRDAPFDYLICLHRGGSGLGFESWPLSVREILPTIPIPLTEGSPDVLINLQRPFDEVYERSLYGRTLNYNREPEPPLSLEDARWADKLLRAKGLRKGEP